MKKPSECYSCDKSFNILFRHRYKCVSCKRTFCSGCIEENEQSIEGQFLMLSKSPVTPGDYCADCSKKKILPHTKKLKFALKNLNKVEVYSINFHGKVPIEPKAKEVKFATKFFRKKDDAENSAKIIAAFMGYDVVYKLKWTKKTESEPGGRENRYYYSVWGCSGLLGKSSKKQ